MYMPFDFFAIKFILKNTGVTVGHLLMKISRATNFLLDGGVTAFIKLYSTNYCVSPLVQGGYKILFRAEMQMPPSLKNREIIELYKSSQKFHEKDLVVGSFLSTNEEIESTLAPCSSSASKKKQNRKREPSAKKK